MGQSKLPLTITRAWLLIQALPPWASAWTRLYGVFFLVSDSMVLWMDSVEHMVWSKKGFSKWCLKQIEHWCELGKPVNFARELGI